MKNISITTVVVGLVVGVIAYKVINRKKETTSSFSSACGCGE